MKLNVKKGMLSVVMSGIFLSTCFSTAVALTDVTSMDQTAYKQPKNATGSAISIGSDEG